MVKDCGKVKTDLSNLIKMGDYFKSPLSLIFNYGKNLLVNGIDILTKITQALYAYHNGDYYTVGKAIGEALIDLSHKSYSAEFLNVVEIRTH